ncbi:septum formation protein [Mycolicibacterium sp. BK556]|uniref:Maf family protein n=1 Tax=Mycobacteriaceae TaxID=1762 RepID=UPI001060AACA|nr:MULTISPECIES: nucleoside triphosphate pyrophosphatase [Mycobacteriaceae]MBB3602467.1 septum formation protein [Mycolicibacterium sp. BK556]MBB3632219.1 septum formation protein [Mycolicibacterium sp. BK607]TDO18491.1 septum formation protein [Mycobacterium sp. BK086]
MTRVVLGSASSGRLRILRSAGIDPVVVVSGVDEDAIVDNLGSDADPGDVVSALAQAKADAVHQVLDREVAADCVVIGCDSMLYVDGQLSGKPGTPEQAARQWDSMAGRDGLLYTGHSLIRVLHGAAVQTVSQAAVTRVRFANPTPADLAAYVASREPLHVAGAFTLDGLGGWFVDGIDGDPSNVVGLGLSVTRRLLSEVGLSIGDLWVTNPVS